MGCGWSGEGAGSRYQCSFHCKNGFEEPELHEENLYERIIDLAMNLYQTKVEK